MKNDETEMMDHPDIWERAKRHGWYKIHRPELYENSFVNGRTQEQAYDWQDLVNKLRAYEEH